MESLRSGEYETTVILLFSRQEDQRIAFGLLGKSAVKSLNQPKMISFLKPKPGVVEGYSGNMTYGLVFCEIICKQPLLDFNGPLSNIDGVVNQVTPPESTLAFVNEGTLDISSIHSEYTCVYIGEKIAIDKFKLSIDDSSVGDDGVVVGA